MAKRKLLSIISVIMCLLSIYISTTSAYAAVAPNEQEIEPLYIYTQSNTASLKINNGTATCYATITGYPQLATKIKITMILEKRTLWWWDEVKSWTNTKEGYYHSLAKKCAVDSGTYRLRAVYVVYSANNKSETITGYSSEVST